MRARALTAAPPLPRPRPPGANSADARLLGMELGTASHDLKLATGELINKVQIKAGAS
jgi:hypothetical protein